ncbi:MAG TPA: hypothetical protein VFC58_06095 [Desulfosporosinus sp.]|nr:hypothetical protein [Desulfosporosinus sp.]
MEADEQNLLVLNEVRKMNRLQRENKQSIGKMSDQITYYQDLFETVIANNRNTNQSIVREIRSNLLRLSILANPNMAVMYRSSKKNHYKIKKDNPKRPV